MKITLAVIIAIVIVGGGYGIYHQTSSHGKGQIINISTGYNLSAPLSRIVSLDPAATATIYTIGAFKTLVGGNSYDEYPPNETLPNVTDYPSMDISQILNLSPQAVISFTAYNQTQVEELLNAGVDYIFLSSGSGTNISVVEKQDTLLGQITGEEKNASLLNTWINESISNLSADSKEYMDQQYNGTEPVGFYYLSSSGGIWTTGNNTFQNSYFKYAHIKNLAVPFFNGFNTISSGEVANGTPQVVFLNYYVNSTAMSQPPFSGSPAYKNHEYYTVPNVGIFDEPNYRDVYAIQWMIEKFYGEKPSIPKLPFDLQYNPNTM